jgi:hypothetical protein
MMQVSVVSSAFAECGGVQLYGKENSPACAQQSGRWSSASSTTASKDEWTQQSAMVTLHDTVQSNVWKIEPRADMHQPKSAHRLLYKVMYLFIQSARSGSFLSHV